MIDAFGEKSSLDMVYTIQTMNLLKSASLQHLQQAASSSCDGIDGMAALQPITVMKIALQQQAAQHPSPTLTVPENSGKGVLIGHPDSPTTLAIKVNATLPLATEKRTAPLPQSRACQKYAWKQWWVDRFTMHVPSLSDGAAHPQQLLCLLLGCNGLVSGAPNAQK